LKAVKVFENFELELSTIEDQFVQGKMVKGALLITNKGKAPLDLTNLKVALSFSALSDAHANQLDKFTILEEKKEEEVKELGVGEKHRFSFLFRLPLDCPVAEKSASPFFLFGIGEQLSHLQLDVQMNARLKEFIRLFETFFRYKSGAVKNKKEGVEVKLTPPNLNQGMGHVDALHCAQRFSATEWLLTLHFSVKKIDPTVGSLKFIKEKKKIVHKLNPQNYFDGDFILDQDGLKALIEASIKDALK